MGVIKGKPTISTGSTREVTTTQAADKSYLDVAVSGVSAGSTEGSNNLSQGTLFYGLEYKRIIKQTSPDAVTDVYNVYSDSAALNLISTATIVYETNKKCIAIDIRRDDV